MFNAILRATFREEIDVGEHTYTIINIEFNNFLKLKQNTNDCFNIAALVFSTNITLKFSMSGANK